MPTAMRNLRYALKLSRLLALLRAIIEYADMTFKISTLWQNKVTRITLELLAGAVALGCLFAVILIGRLASGPMALDDLTPLLTAGLSDNQRGLTTTIANTKLLWNNEKHEVLLELEGVVTRNKAGDVVITLPRADARVKALPLLIGRLSFKRLHIEGANVNLERNADGQLIFLGTEPLAKIETNEQWPLSAILAGWPQRVAAMQDRINRLGEVTVRATKLTVLDRSDNTTIEGFAPELQIGTNEDDEVIGKGLLKVTTKDKPIGIALDMRLLPDNGTGETILSFRDLNPAAVGHLDNDLAALTAVDAPLSGSINVTYMPEGMMQLTLDLEAEQGTLTLASLPAPLPLTKFKTNVSAVSTGSAGVTSAIINNFTVTTGETTLSLSGKLTTRDDPGFRVADVRVQLDNVALDNFIKLWPKGAAEGGRVWVTENMRDGRVGSAIANVHMAIGWPDIDVVEVESVDGTFDLADATIHYHKPMPPAVAVQATGTFDKDGIYIKPTSGKILGLALGAGTVDIKGFNEPVQTISVAIPAVGSLVDILTAVDSPPLRYAAAVGLKPSDMKGDASVNLKIVDLPLLNSLKLDDVQLQANGTVKNFSNSTLVPALPLTNGSLSIALDTHTMNVTGDVQAKGAKVAVDWHEVFSPANGQPSSNAKISGAFTTADFDKLGVPLPGAMVGAAPVLVNYKRHTTRPDELSAQLDLTPVALDLSRLTYQKAAKKKAKLTVDATIGSDTIELKAVNAIADGVSVIGSGTLSAAGEIQTLHFSNAVLGQNKVSVDVMPTPSGALKYTVSGQQMNVGAWLDAGNNSNQQVSQTPFEIDMQLDRAIFGLDTSVPNAANTLKFFAPFKMTASYTGKGWQMITLTGKAGGTEDLTFNLQPTATGKTVMARTDNFGAVLDALNWTDDVIGGKLAIDGSSDSADKPLAAVISVEEYRVRDLPFLARLINAVSLEGIAQLLSNEKGLKFDKLKGDVVIDGDILHFKKLRTAGGSLGLTAAGTINTATKEINLEGTVIPFSGVNTLIGAIPLIGDLLTGGNGGGVFAATYYAKGQLADPKFSTNPLATLAPGIVRNIFFLDDH